VFPDIIFNPSRRDSSVIVWRLYDTTARVKPDTPTMRKYRHCHCLFKYFMYIFFKFVLLFLIIWYRVPLQYATHCRKHLFNILLLLRLSIVVDAFKRMKAMMIFIEFLLYLSYYYFYYCSVIDIYWQLYLSEYFWIWLKVVYYSFRKTTVFVTLYVNNI